MEHLEAEHAAIETAQWIAWQDSVTIYQGKLKLGREQSVPKTLVLGLIVSSHCSSSKIICSSLIGPNALAKVLFCKWEEGAVCSFQVLPFLLGPTKAFIYIWGIFWGFQNGVCRALRSHAWPQPASCCCHRKPYGLRLARDQKALILQICLTLL